MPTATNGMRTRPRPATPSAYAVAEYPPPKGAGWVLFAGIMLMVAATLDVIWGIAAVAGSGFFVAGADYILITSLATWGWIAIGFGALQFLAALSIWRGGEFGRWFGILVAGIALVGALMSMPAYPFWALTLVALDVLVIYGLAAYGGRPELLE
jgi:hypothetical protein